MLLKKRQRIGLDADAEDDEIGHPCLAADGDSMKVVGYDSSDYG